MLTIPFLPLSPLTTTADEEICYFPVDFQGIYVIQTKNNEPGSKVTYSEVPVEADGIPPWGKCFRRKGNQVIFKDTNGAQNCIRCFHLTLKSPNVIQIQTEGKSLFFCL